MESQNPGPGAAKRKRSPGDDGGATSRQLPNPPISHGMTQINYLVKATGEKLRLIEGDSETFADVLGMIDDYEG
jgi:hypothetical protein